MERTLTWLAVSPVFACALASGVALADGPAPAADAAYVSAHACSKCHPTIHGYWSESQHARSATNPVFLESLRTAVEKAPDKEVRAGCVWCHAPTSLVTGDLRLEQALTREGVTCDFCHTVSDVELGKSDHPFRLEPGPVKRGPLEYAKSPAHETAYSPLHRTSPLLCASCHQYTNALGVEVLSTYSEWKQGPSPERGQTCQECHMPLVPGWSVADGLDASQRRINLHRMEGGGTVSRLATGLDLRFEGVTLRHLAAEIEVAVVNRAVGHAAPGGLSSKSLVLGVGVDTGSGDLRNRSERVYRRVLRDEGGRELVAVSDLFLKAAAVGPDTRLRQKETRIERFTLPLPEDWKAIVARLEYRDASGAEPTLTLVREVRRERR